ncbi:MAG: epimerase [Frankiales bacterium]|nr:epimerase [Frankiales bacterium]
MIALIAASLAAALHVGIFYLEALAFSQPKVYRRFMIQNDAEAQIIKPWALNQGWYNLLIAVGTGAGVALFAAGHHDPARSLIAFGCAIMLGAALVLIISDKRMARAAATQGLLPLIALVLLW